MPNLSAASLAQSTSTTPSTFPNTLFHAVCETPDSILQWSDDGKSYCIHSIAAMERVVLPRYFPTTNRFTSMVRKLNRWGFRRVKQQSPFFDDKQYVY